MTENASLIVDNVVLAEEVAIWQAQAIAHRVIAHLCVDRAIVDRVSVVVHLVVDQIMAVRVIMHPIADLAVVVRDIMLLAEDPVIEDPVNMHLIAAQATE